MPNEDPHSTSAEAPLNPGSRHEGVIQFSLQFRPATPPDWAVCSELDAWRTLLHRLGLIGQNPAHYGGLAYGNVSRRLSGAQFLISGSQTGALPQLTSRDYCVVDECQFEHNRLTAHGPIKPSSEAMTHAAVYQTDPVLDYVLHVHSPQLWQQSDRLGIPMTDPSAGYGTPEMARAIGALLMKTKAPVLAMGGHEDGLIACGASVENAALPLLRLLGKALQSVDSGG